MFGDRGLSGNVNDAVHGTRNDTLAATDPS